MPAGNSSARMLATKKTTMWTNKLDSAGLVAISIIPGWPFRVPGVVSCVQQVEPRLPTRQAYSYLFYGGSSVCLVIFCDTFQTIGVTTSRTIVKQMQS